MNLTILLESRRSFNLQMVKISYHDDRSFLADFGRWKIGCVFCRNWDQRHLACLDDARKLVSGNIAIKSLRGLKFSSYFFKKWKKTFQFNSWNQKVRKISFLICFNWTFLKQVFCMGWEKIVPHAKYRNALRRLLRISGL